MTIPSVRRELVLAAPPDVVYRAWLTPDTLQQWMVPGPYECSRAEVDERVGGRFRIWHTDAGESAGGFEAEFLELVPDRRIVWRWGFTGPQREAGPTYDSLLTVTFDELTDGGTRLVLLHEQLDALAAALPKVVEQVGSGWDGAFDKLTVVVKQ